MCSPLKGLVTEAAHVTAVLAVSLPTVASQCVGILAHLIAVVTLVPSIGLRLAVLPALMAVVGNLDRTQRLVSGIFAITHKSSHLHKDCVFPFCGTGYLCLQYIMIVS